MNDTSLVAASLMAQADRVVVKPSPGGGSGLVWPILFPREFSSCEMLLLRMHMPVYCCTYSTGVHVTRGMLVIPQPAMAGDTNREKAA